MRLSVTFCLAFVLFAPLQAIAFSGVEKSTPLYTTAETITSVGSNRHPWFITADSIIFVSASRKEHKDPQIYLKELKTGKETRITHQRGILTNSIYLPHSKKLLYSSTTDEDKESPYVLKQYLKRFPSSVANDDFFQIEFPAQEIYESQIDGSEIKRLTDSSGYDGFPAYLASKDRLYFSRWHSGRLSIFAKSLSKNLAPWRVTKTLGHDIGLQLSPKEKLFVWNRFSPDFKTSQILISPTNFKDPKFLTLDTGVSWNPVWHPSGQSIIYSARQTNMNNFDLFEVSLDGNCQRQITALPGDESFPTISPDGKTILFTATQSGSQQIHTLPYPEAKFCESAQVDDPSEETVANL